MVMAEKSLQLSNGSVIELVRADITLADTDVIVNAANSHLNHGGGVAAAIARAAGDDLVRESSEHSHVPTGSAGVTSGGLLKARWVVHAVGPVWNGGGNGEVDLLASAYRASLTLAAGLGAESISFPSLSTGIFGFPLDLAATTAIPAVAQGLGEARSISLVRWCLFSDEDLAAYSEALQAIA